MKGLLFALALTGFAQAQWTLQESHSSASLRGVHSAGGGVAWASGTAGTVLRTSDGGETWTSCAAPPNAEKLDFRGVQAFDANTALVMSSGKGGLSRLYKTKDGCRSWRLVFSNPDQAGFWDGLQFDGPQFGVLVGDPVDGVFPVFTSSDGGETWQRSGVAAEKNQSLFAASNTSLLIEPGGRRLFIATGGGTTALIADGAQVSLPLAKGEAAGAFSIGLRMVGGNLVLVAVGGDYKHPDETAGTAAWRSADGVWHAAETPPNGYRSAVAWDSAGKAWIAAGPNGTDVSTDDGRTWKAMPDGGGSNWNALSLPFAVGSKGRIGKLAP